MEKQDELHWLHIIYQLYDPRWGRLLLGIDCYKHVNPSGSKATVSSMIISVCIILFKNITVNKFIYSKSEPDRVHMFLVEMSIDDADPEGGRISNWLSIPKTAV